MSIDDGHRHLADEVVKLQAKCGDVENLLFLEEKRTANLQAENARLKAERDETLRENDRRWRERRTKEEAETARLREALAFYASDAAGSAYIFPTGDVTIDAGRRARQALAANQSKEKP